MIKVLHVMTGSEAGGISAVVLNYYSHIDRSKIHFDVVLTVNVKGHNERRLEELGVKFYSIPLKSQNLQGYKSVIAMLISQNHYNAIHVHENDTSYVALQVAKNMGVKCRIAHAHTAHVAKGIKAFIRRLASRTLNPYFATKIIGCGIMAGNVMFGQYSMKSKKGIVLPNAVDTRLFSFDEKLRNEVRRELGIGLEFVVGMVGRISSEKNNVYAIELFQSIKRRVPNALLVIVGSGPDEAIMQEKIKELNLADRVKFLGYRSDVYRLYQAFDIYLMPSFYEGFPVAATEAMASGLPILLSDTITDELKFGKCVRYISLQNKEAWANAAMEFVSGVDRRSLSKEVKDNGLDINDTVRTLEQIYLEQCN